MLGDRIGRVAIVRAGVVVADHLAGDDAAILHHAVLVVEPPGGARRRDAHLFLAGIAVLDRPAGLHGSQDRDRLDDDVHLAAEAAAHRAADEVQVLEGRLQDQRAVVQREEERLRVGVDGVAAVGLRAHDAAGGFGRRVLDGAGGVAFLDDVVGLVEGPLDVAIAYLAEGVALAVLVVVDEVVGAPRLEDRRARLERLFDVEDRRQLLQVETDLVGGLGGRSFGLREDGGDLFALPEHLVLRQHRFIVGADADQAEDGVDVLGHVIPGQRAHEAGYLLGLGEVDAADDAVVDRAAHHLEIERVGKGDVVDVDRLAGDVAEAIAARHGLADNVQFLGGHACASFPLLAAIRPAAS